MSREAMQMALEAMELYQSKSSVQMFDDAVKALRQALETEQEPVAHVDHRIHGWPDCLVIKADPPHTSPLYLSLPKREWVGLTDEDYKELSKIAFVEVIEKIERVLKEKNT